MAITDLIYLFVIVYGISYSLVNLDGFYSVFYLIRYIGIKPYDNITFKEAYLRTLTDESSDYAHKITNNFGKLLSCILCTGLWISFLTVPLYLYLKGDYRIVFDILFIYGLVILFNEIKK